MVPLPDADCRRRLVRLYGAKQSSDGYDIERIVRQTENVSAAFIRELIRKATLIALDEGFETVQDRHFEKALTLLREGFMTSRLLGCREVGGE